jgi:predicted nucleic acid-binding protein
MVEFLKARQRGWIPARGSAICSGTGEQGQLIDDFDIAVAAIALAHGAGVITANLSHFARVEGQRSRHWT